MRILVISDMEGVAGICRWNQVAAGADAYEEGRKLYTEEINAAVRGACNAGANEVIVMDCHGAGGDRSFHSLIPQNLDPRCEFVVQRNWTEYTHALEQGCDASVFIGQHAMAGSTNGVLSHTVSSSEWHELKFNGVAVGEVGINAALCGTWNCPVAIVTGDDAVCEESTALLGPDLKTVAVKQALGRFSARHLTPARACERIQQGVREALKDLADAPIYKPADPCKIEVELGSSDHAAEYTNRNGVTIANGRSLTSIGDTWWDAWRQFYL